MRYPTAPAAIAWPATAAGGAIARSRVRPAHSSMMGIDGIISMFYYNARRRFFRACVNAFFEPRRSSP
jgi:hypothetical protein